MEEEVEGGKITTQNHVARIAKQGLWKVGMVWFREQGYPLKQTDHVRGRKSPKALDGDRDRKRRKGPWELIGTMGVDWRRRGKEHTCKN